MDDTQAHPLRHPVPIMVDDAPHSSLPSPDLPLDLAILGLGTEYPPHSLEPSTLDTLVERHYEKTPAMAKVLSINRFTGIDTRSAIGPVDHPIANQPTAPSIAELSELFLTDGVALAVTAARKALAEASLVPFDITHVVSTTCTNSANPGYDQYVCDQLGITQPVEKILLHGIGCSGGLAALRTAANVALGSSFRTQRARVLILALEISSTLVRSELDSINELQETRIGVTLFSDCAGAIILSNGIGEPRRQEPPLYELLGWEHRIIPDTTKDLGFDVDPLGWKVVLSPRVPKLAEAVVPGTFKDLLAHLPPLPSNYSVPSDFDWALHPGGATILTGIERAMALKPEHMRASYDTYIKHGNSSSATIISVLDRLRHADMDALAPDGRVKDYVVACSFGPGISVEMAMLKRVQGRPRADVVERGLARQLSSAQTGQLTPPDSDHDDATSELDLEARTEQVKADEVALEERLRTLHPEVPQQNGELSHVLGGVELD